MMDATKQAEAGLRLEKALEAAGVIVSRGVFAAGSLKAWVTVDGASILGLLQAMTGWRVDVEDGTITPDLAKLALVPDDVV